jgi:hypothetical protein
VVWWERSAWLSWLGLLGRAERGSRRLRGGVRLCS